MKIIIFGGDGYLGWPTAMYLSKKNIEVYCVDNFSKRKIELENGIKPLFNIETMQNRVKIWNKKSKVLKRVKFVYGDLLNHRFLYEIVNKIKPDAVVHYAEQPSAPYSMAGRDQAVFSQHNNIIGSLNLLFAIKKYCPNCHIVKLGTMGTYGTPNIIIEEGFLKVKHKGRSDVVQFPMKPQSFYHLSKAADSLNLAFACRVWGMRATDLNQGVVYGTDTNETKLSEELRTSFHYDHLFGTVINRFLVEASENIPLTIYGGGEQKRTFLNINDTLRCVELALKNPAKKGEYKVRNQFTEIFSIKELAQKILIAGKNIGITVKIKNIKNPRVEMSKHYYRPTNKSFIRIGLKPILLKIKYLEEQILMIKKNVNKKIIRDIINPKVQWNQKDLK